MPDVIVYENDIYRIYLEIENIDCYLVSISFYEYLHEYTAWHWVKESYDELVRKYVHEVQSIETIEKINEYN